MRPSRHPREQCRDQRPKAASGLHARRVAPGPRHQPHQRVPVLAGRLRADEGGRRRQDHQHRLDDVDLRRLVFAGVRSEQGRAGPADQIARDRLGQGQHPGERGAPGLDRHRADPRRASSSPGAPRQRAPTDTRWTLGYDGGHGGHRGLPGKRRIQLRHRHRDPGRRWVLRARLSRMRVLVVDAIAPEGLAYLRERSIQVDELAKPTLETLYARIGDYDGLITRSGTAVTAELLDHAPRLRIVGRAGVGVDNVDTDACSRRGILVCNAPDGNVVSAAEHTIGMLLALVRRIPEAHARLEALEWNRGIYGAELYRKTVGVVGLGKVGSRVAARLRGFETDVVVYDPYIPESRAKDLGARAVDFETLLREADIVTFHVPPPPQTENMVAARELARMKRGVRLVNCARGGIVNEADLLARSSPSTSPASRSTSG